jgi:hypothetical protein
MGDRDRLERLIGIAGMLIDGLSSPRMVRCPHRSERRAKAKGFQLPLYPDGRDAALYPSECLGERNCDLHGFSQATRK